MDPTLAPAAPEHHETIRSMAWWVSSLLTAGGGAGMVKVWDIWNRRRASDKKADKKAETETIRLEWDGLSEFRDRLMEAVSEKDRTIDQMLKDRAAESQRWQDQLLKVQAENGELRSMYSNALFEINALKGEISRLNQRVADLTQKLDAKGITS